MSILSPDLQSVTPKSPSNISSGNNLAPTNKVAAMVVAVAIVETNICLG